MTYTDPVQIVIAEDDDEDFELTQQALARARVNNVMTRTNDGLDLLDCLRGEGRFAVKRPPGPVMVLLDLNMPRMDGRAALKEIKADPALRHIPVVVLTTSSAEEDIVRSYDCGVSSFITKPVTFGGLVDAMIVLGRYWFEIVSIPR